MADPKEKYLLSLLKSDDKSALRTLFEAYHVSLCSISYRLIRDRDAAKDVVQEVFIKFWNNRQSIEITSSLTAYLKRSVINTSLNYLEKTQRNRHVELDTLTHHPIALGADQNQVYIELSNQIDLAIQNLPDRTRAVFVLIRQEEMSYKEASEFLHISVKAVEKEMMKALKLLRESLRHLLSMVILASGFI
jgi:RNA polymerase sigma-70 factor (ECF subfamily)